MENRDDYKLIFYVVHAILDNSYYDSVAAFAPDKITCSEYSLYRPAFQFTTKKDVKEEFFLIYVIEINHNITNEIIQSWINHSKNCDFLFLYVPEEIKINIESRLAREISNYSVISFRIEKKGRNRFAIINPE